MIAMNAVDRAWLEMDQPGTPMVIGVVIQLDGPVDAAAFQKTLVERLLMQPRFRQRVELLHGATRWVAEGNMDFTYHIQVRRLPENGFERHLRRAVSCEASRDLDHRRPLWRLLLFPRPNGPITLLFRVHHAIADGIALVTLLTDSTDAGACRTAARYTAERQRRLHSGPLGKLIDRLEVLNTSLEWVAGRLGSRHGKHGLAQGLLRQAWASAGAIRRILTLPDDSPQMFRRVLNGHRSVTWADGIAFTPLRGLAKRMGVSVNDLFMALLTGALGRQLGQIIAQLPEQQNLRVSIPVNLRMGRGRELGNQFGVVMLDLPIGIADFGQRLKAVAERMALLKGSPEANLTLIGLSAVSHLPLLLEKRAIRIIAAKSVAVVSNLPGPKRHVRIAGARMRSLMFWPPQAGGIGLGVSFFTYAGQVSIGISADQSVLPRPQELLDRMCEEIQHLIGTESQRTLHGSVDVATLRGMTRKGRTAVAGESTSNARSSLHDARLDSAAGQ
jgi:diacylglycerol O-acyltransferase